MLTKEDIGHLFSVMRASYGNQWPHKSDAVEVWLRMLGGYHKTDLDNAIRMAIQNHPNFPPSLGQFEALVSGPKPQRTTYLPPPDSPRNRKIANKTMLNVMMQTNGVESFTLKNMVLLKNALYKEWGEKVSKKDVKDLHDELMGLVGDQI